MCRFGQDGAELTKGTVIMATKASTRGLITLPGTLLLTGANDV